MHLGVILKFRGLLGTRSAEMEKNLGKDTAKQCPRKKGITQMNLCGGDECKCQIFYF